MKFCSPVWVDELPSTNTELIARLQHASPPPNGFVLAARTQTAGRGRYERQWVTQPGRDLTFSAIIHTDTRSPHIFALPMAAALAIVDLLTEYGVTAQTKWPNDVLVSGRKICGLLAEGNNRGDIVVGVGINVNMTIDDTQMIDKPATSLSIETGAEHDVKHVLDNLLPYLEHRCTQWADGGFPALASTWRKHCYNLGNVIRVGDGDEYKIGTLIGFGQAGQMIIRDDNDHEFEVWVGDVAF